MTRKESEYKVDERTGLLKGKCESCKSQNQYVSLTTEGYLCSDCEKDLDSMIEIE